MKCDFFLVLSLFVTFFATAIGHAGDGEQRPAAPIKVFILAGQSNMEGHGQTHSLKVLGEHPEFGHWLKKLQTDDGKWKVRDDVSISWSRKDPIKGPLTVGWGYDEKEIGPELLFGTVMGDHFKEPVLLIKTAWGGKDVYCDFRSPLSGPPQGDVKKFLDHRKKEGEERETGLFYRKMIQEIREALAEIGEPDSYELAGMAWFQGWNDFCQWHVELDGEKIGATLIADYPSHLEAMIRDIRKDLGAPELPFVIGELGVGGEEMEIRARKNENDGEAQAMMAFRKAQKRVANIADLNNVSFVPTTAYWDERLEELRKISDRWWNEKKEKGIPDTDDNQLPTPELNREFRARGGHWYCHYNGSAMNYSLVGLALAEELLRLSRP